MGLDISKEHCNYVHMGIVAMSDKIAYIEDVKNKYNII